MTLTTSELRGLKDSVLVLFRKDPHPRKDLFLEYDSIINACNVDILEIFVVQSDLNALGLKRGQVSKILSELW